MKTDSIKKLFIPGRFGLSNAAYYFLLVIYVLLLLLFLMACSKDEYDFEKFGGTIDETGWGIPLAHNRLDILKIVKDSDHVYTGSDKLVRLVYKNERNLPSLSGLIRIPDVQFASDYSFSMPEYVPEGEVIQVPYRQLVDFGSKDGMQIDELNISSCQVELLINTDLNRNAAFTVTLPGAIKNGNPYRVLTEYHYKQSGSNPVTIHLDLSGYDLSFEKKNGAGTYLEVLFDVKITNDPEPDLSPYHFTMTESISNVQFTGFKGYLGNIPLPIDPGLISLELFKNRLSGSLDFENPIMRFIVKNSYGIPFGLEFRNLRTSFADPGFSPVEITSPLTEEPWKLLYPFDGSGKEMVSWLELNAGNSNIATAFKNGPDFLTQSLLAHTNPDAYAIQNYFNPTSACTIYTELELPFYGTARYLCIQDLYPLNFRDFNPMNSAIFNLNITNSFPVDTRLQVYFADKRKQVLDSLFVEEQWVEHAPADPNTFEVTQPVHTTLRCSFDGDRLQKIMDQTAAVYVKAVLNTPGDEPVKIFTDNYIDVQIALKYTR